MKFVERAIAAYAGLLLRRPGTLLLGVVVLTVASLWAGAQLTINTNQLDLISQDLQAVKDVKRVVDMVGGAGHLIIGLRGRDETTLKAVADDLAAGLKADKAHVRNAVHKIDTSFVRTNAPMFVETADLAEVRRQGQLKIKDVIRRNSPFFLEIKPTPPYEPTLDPIIEKYKRVGKKSIADDYYISDDRLMVLIVVKPMWDSNQLAQTGELVELLRQRFAAYSAKNPHGATLTESYEREPALDGKQVGFGFTGSYKTSYDDSFEMKASLGPTSLWSFAGVLLVVIAFLGRRPGAILIIMGTMMAGLAITFGFTWATVGQLNMVTSILAAILMGMGIDFAIHFVYRLRHYLGTGLAVEAAVRETVVHAGTAALVAAMAGAASFFALLFSEFRGFSQFGLLAGAGTVIIGASVFVAAPALLLLLGRRWPRLPLALVGSRSIDDPASAALRVPVPRVLLGVAGLAVVVTSAFGPGVRFEYNTRALMVEHQPSVRLQDEVAARYQISADPVAVYTKTLADTKKLYDELNPLNHKKYSTIDQVVSMFTFVPPADQQARNAKILTEWKGELTDIDAESLPPDIQDKYKQLLGYLDTKPYALEQLPNVVRKQFEHLPQARPENRGFLTFIYPVVDLWDGKQMLKFAEEVEEIHTADGTTFRAAGLPILFAHLAKIVLHDGRFSSGLTIALLVILLLVDFRSARAASVALVPLLGGMGAMLGVMALMDWSLNFMNIVVFPIVLGSGISHGVYLMHRFEEGASPLEALKTVGNAILCSTLTTLAGWAGLLAAGHKGLKSMGILACVGMSTTLLVTLFVMPAVLQLMHDRRARQVPGPAPTPALARDPLATPPEPAEESA
ncbi:MAG: export protein [Myxococcales bacterium]|nr:export protein [Myxococcales bacterium]